MATIVNNLLIKGVSGTLAKPLYLSNGATKPLSPTTPRLRRNKAKHRRPTAASLGRLPPGRTPCCKIQNVKLITRKRQRSSGYPIRTPRPLQIICARQPCTRRVKSMTPSAILYPKKILASARQKCRCAMKRAPWWKQNQQRLCRMAITSLIYPNILPPIH